jgi:hypothetical protein
LDREKGLGGVLALVLRMRYHEVVQGEVVVLFILIPSH